MMFELMILLSMSGGMLLSVQAAMNSRLGKQIGAVRATLINFLVGSVLTALLVFFLEPPRQISLMDVPKWQLTGAFFGIVYILLMTLGVRTTGTAAATVGAIIGQLCMSILVDTQGWFSNHVIPLSTNRMLALLFLSAALYLIYSSNRLSSRQELPPKVVNQAVKK